MSRVASAVLAEPPGPRPEKLPGCATDRARGARCALLRCGGAAPAAQQPAWSRHCGAWCVSRRILVSRHPDGSRT